MLNSARFTRFIGIAAATLSTAACSAIENISAAPKTPGDLVVSAIQIGDTPAGQTARAKVSTSVRIRATIRNDGGTTIPATVARVNIGGRRVADIPTPAIDGRAEVIVETMAMLDGGLLIDVWRDYAQNAKVQVCANVNATVTDENSYNNCLETESTALRVMPNLENDCQATGVSAGVQISVNPNAGVCPLYVWRGVTSVRFIDVKASSRVALDLLPVGQRGTAYLWILGEDGAAIDQWDQYSSSSAPISFAASIPGRYYIATWSDRPFTVKATWTP